MKRVGLSLWIFLLLGLGQVVAAPADGGRLIRVNLFAADGIDPRQTGPVRADAPYAPVGLVTTLGPVPYPDGRRVITTGTGFPVSPCLVLTNYHGVFGRLGDIPFPPPGIAVSIWSRAGEAVRSAGAPIAWGDLGGAGENDWALVRLDECIGARADIGWFALEPVGDDSLPERLLSTAGYAGDIKGRFTQQGCRVHAINPDHKALNDCANRGGTSGSPLFYLKDGAPTAVALQRGELNSSDPVLPAYSPDHANTAVLIARILEREDVARAIAEDLAASAVDNPLRGRNGPEAKDVAAGPS
ncbi:MAG: trypsin-like peptidase domain-containing protein [Caulobacteraceae bacterium]